MRSDGGADISRDGGRTADAGGGVLVLGVVVPQEWFRVHGDGAGDGGPVRQGRVVGGGVGRHAAGAGAGSCLSIRRYARTVQETVLTFAGTAGIRVSCLSTFLQFGTIIKKSNSKNIF